MNIFSFGKNFLLLATTLVIITIFAYKDIFNLFYQQDEWQNIGNNLVYGSFSDLFTGLTLAKLLAAQDRFAAIILSYIFFGKLAFNTVAMAWYSIIFHTVNSLLVLFLIRKWVVKDNLFAFLGALFFALSSVAFSAVSWFGTSLGTLPSVTLVLLSLIFYFNYLDNFKIKWVCISFFILYVSLFFKEIGIFLFILMPLGTLLYKKFTPLGFAKVSWPFFLTFFAIVTTRVFWFFSVDRSSELFVSATTSNNLPTILARVFFYPLTSLSLTFIPPEPIINFAKDITNIYYPFFPSEQFNLIAQTVVIDVIALATTLVILFSLFLCVNYLSFKNKQPLLKKHAIFWTVFFILSFLPYVLLGKSYAYLESRYYYLSSLPAGIILSFVGWAMYKFLSKWKLGIVSILCLTMFLFVHLAYLEKSLNEVVDISQERRSFLSQLSEVKPKLDSDKNIFLITGSQDFYIPGNNVPFQQGMGYTLMVWYYKEKEELFNRLIHDKFLWNLGTQGYKTNEKYGFGYFNNEMLLREELHKHNLVEDDVTALYYDSGNKTLSKVDLKFTQ